MVWKNLKGDKAGKLKGFQFGPILIVLFLFPLLLSAQETEIDEEDPFNLPSESVTPILDSRLAYYNKSILFDGRFKASFLFQSLVDEMFFNPNSIGLGVHYYFFEDHSLGLNFLQRLSGLSTYSDQLKESTSQIEISRAPSPKSFLSLVYRYSLFYGKISFSTFNISQTTLSLELEGGSQTYSNTALPFLGVGFLQEIYITKGLAFGLGYKILSYQAVDPISVDVTSDAVLAVPTDFKIKNQLGQALNLSLSYLF